MNKEREKLVRRLSWMLNATSGGLAFIRPPTGVLFSLVHKSSVSDVVEDYLEKGKLPIEGVQIRNENDDFPKLLRGTLRKTYLAAALGTVVSLGMNGFSPSALLLNKKLFDQTLEATQRFETSMQN